MSKAEMLTVLAREDWQRIRRERDQWFRDTQFVPSAALLGTALALICAALVWMSWLFAVLGIFFSGMLAERFGEQRGYDSGYEHGFYAGFQRCLDQYVVRPITSSEEENQT